MQDEAKNVIQDLVMKNNKLERRITKTEQSEQHDRRMRAKMRKEQLINAMDRMLAFYYIFSFLYNC